MKLDNKGFMMAEVIVVSAIVLVFLTGLFISYNNIYSAYNNRLDYYDTASLYRLGFYKDYYTDNNTFNNIKSDALSNTVTEITSLSVGSGSNYQEKVFMIYNNNNNLSTNVLDSKNVNATYKDYVNYLSTSTDLTSYSYVMIIERCDKDDIDDCKYAYLEVE